VEKSRKDSRLHSAIQPQTRRYPPCTESKLTDQQDRT
jgi:hypothetical protein